MAVHERCDNPPRATGISQCGWVESLGGGGGKLKAMTAGRRNPKKGGRETEKMQDKLESD
jgi:hypothetical protein